MRRSKISEQVKNSIEYRILEGIRLSLLKEAEKTQTEMNLLQLHDLEVGQYVYLSIQKKTIARIDAINGSNITITYDKTGYGNDGTTRTQVQYRWSKRKIASKLVSVGIKPSKKTFDDGEQLESESEKWEESESPLSDVKKYAPKVNN